MREKTTATQPDSGSSRRNFILGSAAAVVVAGGAGAGAAFLTSGKKSPLLRPNPPADLIAAVQAERDLISAVDRATAARSVPAGRLALIRSNHLAHLQALLAAIELQGQTGPTSTPPPASSSSPAGPPVTVSMLRRGEMSAASVAAATALRLTGAEATLLASISACEASHAELLT